MITRSFGSRSFWLIPGMLLLASCGQHSGEAQQVPTMMAELQASVDAAKQNPSFAAGSKLAGPPIHVDPYVHSKGMTHMSGMGSLEQTAHPHSAK
jgi:hypothetical protein